MSANALLGGSRFGFSALAVLALVLAAALAALRWASPRAAAVDAGDLAADPGARLGREVVVTGEWEKTAPSESGYLVVVLRGRNGGRVACHFEDVPAAQRGGLEARLLRPGEVAVRGRCDGVEDGMAVLRGCSPLD